jgi:hypothetical protein
LAVHHLTPFGLAGLAPLGFILETLVGKKQLFPCSENEVRAAINTLEDPIPVFHDSLPLLEQGLTRINMPTGAEGRGFSPSPHLSSAH